MHSFFYGWIVFHCVYAPHLLYLFICQWTSRLLPCPCYGKEYCYEHCGQRGGQGVEFSGGTVVKNSLANERDMCSIPRSGRSPGIENGNPLQYSCQDNSRDRGGWWATIHGVARSVPQVSTHTCNYYEHWNTNIFSIMVFSGYTPSSGNAGSYDSFIPSF